MASRAMAGIPLARNPQMGAVPSDYVRSLQKMAANPAACVAETPGLAYTSRELSLVRQNRPAPASNQPSNVFHFGQAVPNIPAAYAMNPGLIRFPHEGLARIVATL